MKRFLFMAMFCGVTAAPLLAVDTFTPSVGDLQLWNVVNSFTNETQTPGWGNDFGAYTTPGGDYGAPTLSGVVGFHGSGVGGVSELNWLAIGGNADLSGTSYDSFALVICNDNNQDWEYRLFAGDGVSESYSYGGAWQSIAPGDCMSLSVDLTGLDLANLTIGFQIGRSDQPDIFHTSVAPIPAPGAVLLGSIGVGVVGWLKRRRSM